MKNIFFNAIITLMLAMCMVVNSGWAQSGPQKVVEWRTDIEKKGDQWVLKVNGQLLEKDWHIWSIDLESEYLIRTEIELEPTSQVELLSDWNVTADVKHIDDDIFGAVSYYTSDMLFSRQLKLKNPQTSVLKGYIISQACNNTSCLPPVKESFTVNLQ